jgi:DNA-binding transcriptional ArsR family regulator
MAARATTRRGDERPNHDTRAGTPAPLDRREAEDVANLFRVLADPTRVAILHALADAELCNGHLAAAVRLSESAVSHQMRELRLLKLVTAEKRGRMVFYRLSDSHVRHVLEDTLRHARESAGAHAGMAGAVRRSRRR